MESSHAEPISREVWLRFFSVHSKAVQSPETQLQLRLEIESGQPPASAIVSLREDSMVAAGIDPVVGLAQLQKLPLQCSAVPLEGKTGEFPGQPRADQAEGVLQDGSVKPQSANQQATEEARAQTVQATSVGNAGSAAVGPLGLAGGGAGDTSAGEGARGEGVNGARPEGAPDLELVRALCRMNTEEDILMDELSLTPLVFAQKKMQGQMVGRQQSKFLEGFAQLDTEDQLELLERARGRMERERGSLKWKAARASGEDALSSREIWDLLYTQLNSA